MAFQYKMSDRRGNPKIRVYNGHLEIDYNFSTSTEKVTAAEEFLMNKQDVLERVKKILNYC